MGVKSDRPCGGCCRTKIIPGGSVAERTRKQTRVTVSGVRVQFRSLLLSYVPVAFHEPLGQVLGVGELVNETALASFLGSCQFKFGGIGKAPGERPGKILYVVFLYVPYEHLSLDPYHTYLSLAAIAMFPPPESAGNTWVVEPLDPLINARLSTAQWARDHIPSKTM